MAAEGQAPIVTAAELLLGPPHKTSKPPKYFFGADATIKVDSETGEFFDYQADTGGSIYDLVKAYLPPGLYPEDDPALAETWLKAKGIFTDAAGGATELPDDEAEERALLGFLLVKPEYLNIIEEEIGVFDFINPLHAKLFTVFSDARDHSYVADIKGIIAALGDSGLPVLPGFTLAQYVARLAADTPVQFPEPEQLSRELARAIARGADIDRGVIESEPEPKPLPAFPHKLGAVRWSEMHRPRAKYQYLVKGIIPLSESVVIYGRRQSGKSFFAFDLAMSIARGKIYFGWRKQGHKVIPGLVIYCAVEGQSGFVDVRMPAYELHHGIPKGEDLPFVCITKRFNLFRNDNDLKLLIEEISAIRQHYKLPLVTIVIDTYNKATTGADEIKGVDVSIIIERLDKLRDHFGCGIWLVHHENANGGMRGHTSLGDNFETVIRVENTKAAYDDNRRPIRTATLEKQREGDNESWSFVLERVELGRDEDGDPITSCVVAAPVTQFEERPTASDKTGIRINHPSTRLYYRCLVEAMQEFGGAPTPEMKVRCPKGTWVVHLEKWREVCLRKMASTSAAKDPGDSVRKGTGSAATKFSEAGLIGVDMPWIWFTDKKVDSFPKMVFGSNVIDMKGEPINQGGKEAEFPDDELPLT